MVILAAASMLILPYSWDSSYPRYKAEPGHPGSSNGCRAWRRLGWETPDTLELLLTYHPIVIPAVNYRSSDPWRLRSNTSRYLVDSYTIYNACN